MGISPLEAELLECLKEEREAARKLRLKLAKVREKIEAYEITLADLKERRAKTDDHPRA